MNEKHADELLSAYFDDEASPRQRSQVERRLGSSSETRRELDEIDRLSDLIRSLPRERAPADLATAVLRRTKQEPQLAQKQPAGTTSRTRTGMAVAATLVTTAAALFAMTRAFDRPTADQIAQIDRVDESARGHAVRDVAHALEDAPAEMAATPSTTASPQTESLKSTARNHGAVGGGNTPRVPSVDARPAEEVPKALPAFAYRAGSPESAQTIDLKKVRPGDVIPHFQRVGDRVAWVDVTVVDVRKAIGNLQVLLSKNGIPPIADQPLEVPRDEKSRGGKSPRPDESTDGLFTIYVVATERQLAATLAVMGKQDLFVDLQLKPSGDLNETVVAALDARAAGKSFGRRTETADEGAPRQRRATRKSLRLEAHNLRPRRTAAPGGKSTKLAGEAKAKKQAEPRREAIENAKPGKKPGKKSLADAVADAETQTPRTKAERKRDLPAPVAGGRRMAAIPGEAKPRSFWLSCELPADVLSFRSRVESSKTARKDEAVRPTPAAADTAKGKPVVSDGRSSDEPNQSIRVMFVFHARSAKPR